MGSFLDHPHLFTYLVGGKTKLQKLKKINKQKKRTKDKEQGTAK